MPTILLGHSFGGLVIKKAIVIASTNPQYSRAYNSIVGLVFLGTPHRGTRLANASRWWWLGASSDIRSVLELGSDALSELDRSFLNVPFVRDENNAAKIHCFYELEPTIYGPSWLRLYSIFTVDKTSATWPGRPSQGLTVRHSDLVKFANKEDLNYMNIVAVLHRIIDQAGIFDHSKDIHI
ncbi:hypothetical protein BJY01DRAFT_248263 [Aspergillus pseudoustus]|uniref:GPI inositol-deacylase n=1 Tax=Aspergillus pseudoustus TaxID=1810923 RepID=A0ABR4JX09_9EURO